MNGKRFLVINADDLGYNEERDRGIFECFLDNSVSSSSILANGVFSLCAAQKAIKIGLPTGLHFNITEGIPITKGHELSSITDGNGLFLGKSQMVKAAVEGKVDKNDVLTELSSQIHWFKQVFGSLPQHVDGHQHIHITPTVNEAFCETMNQLGIKWTRMPVEDGDTPSTLGDFLDYVVTAATSSRQLFHNHGLRHTDKFVGLRTMGRNMSTTALQSFLRDAFRNSSQTTSNSVELMVHPGHACLEQGGCGTGPDDFSKSGDREHEMVTLRCESMRRFYDSEKIQLVSYKELECLTSQDALF